MHVVSSKGGIISPFRATSAGMDFAEHFTDIIVTHNTKQIKQIINKFLNAFTPLYIMRLRLRIQKRKMRARVI